MKSKNAAPGEWPGRRLDDELFEAICLGGAGFNKKLGEKAIWLMLRQMRRQSAFLASRLMTLGAHAPTCAGLLAVNWSRSSYFSDMHQFKLQNDTSARSKI